MPTFTFTGTKAVPESAEMIEGETNKLTFNLAPLAQSATFSSTPTITCDGLTFAGTAASGNTVTAFVSGGTAGKDYIAKLTIPLSSGETKVRSIRLEWKSAGYSDRAGTL